jgi:hypothetical protein
MHYLKLILQEFFKKKYLTYRNKLIIKLVGDHTKVMINIHVTSDIIKYNKFNFAKGDILVNNAVTTVSSRQSFVYGVNSDKHYRM